MPETGDLVELVLLYAMKLASVDLMLKSMKTFLNTTVTVSNNVKFNKDFECPCSNRHGSVVELVCSTGQ